MFDDAPLGPWTRTATGWWTPACVWTSADDRYHGRPARQEPDATRSTASAATTSRSRPACCSATRSTAYYGPPRTVTPRRLEGEVLSPLADARVTTGAGRSTDSRRVSMTPRTPRGARATSRWCLAVLILAYTFNFLDRQILGILAGPHQGGPGPDGQPARPDGRAGLRARSTPAWAFPSACAGGPLEPHLDHDRGAGAVERLHRRSAAWPPASGSCSCAGWAWAWARPAAWPGLFADRRLFPEASSGRGRWRPIPSASPMGSALGIPVRRADRATPSTGEPPSSWSGLAGVALVADVPAAWCASRGAVRRQRRPCRRVAAQGAGAASRLLLAKPSFWLISLGAAASSVCGYGVAFWLPSFFERSLGMGLVDRSLFLARHDPGGRSPGRCGAGGCWATAWGPSARPAAYLLVPAVAFLLALPCFVLAGAGQGACGWPSSCS